EEVSPGAVSGIAFFPRILGIPFGNHPVPHVNPLADSFEHNLVHEDVSFLVALADKTDSAFFEIDIPDFNLGDFGPAQTAADQKQQDGTVTNTFFGTVVTNGEQAAGFSLGKSTPGHFAGDTVLANTFYRPFAVLSG
ncbi:MAG: hypothetical protein SOX97_02740, partial [Sutterella sp.]|nr:hypothetical protein [Sutterella sp.]